MTNNDTHRVITETATTDYAVQTDTERGDRFADCLDTVRRVTAPGRVVATTQFNFSDDGETRSVSIIALGTDHEGRPTAWNVSHVFALVTGEPYSVDDSAIRVQGGGMDTGEGFIRDVVRQVHGDDAELPTIIRL